ncbi:MAG: hypothetical protein RL491_791 [Bacteroidota bacterium]
MSNNLKNILALIAGLLLGAAINSLIIRLNGTLIPMPEGTDVSTPEGLARSMSLFQPIHFMAPFMAHALGTFFASLITVQFAGTPSLKRAMVPGILFLAGGVLMVVILDAPLWFEITDLVLAYIPMAWLGFKLGTRNKK